MTLGVPANRGRSLTGVPLHVLPASLESLCQRCAPGRGDTHQSSLYYYQKRGVQLLHPDSRFWGP